MFELEVLDRVSNNSTERDRSNPHPPVSLLFLAIAEVLLLLVLLLPDNRACNWVGYFIGALIIPSTISIFRSVDKTRKRSGQYSAPPWAHVVPTPILICGVALAAVHAFFVALVEKLA